MNLVTPDPALIILVGASGSGKTAWALRCLRPTEVVSSDGCRRLVADDEADQDVNHAAFAVFYEIIRQRLGLRRYTLANSTGLQGYSRKRLLSIGRRAKIPVHLIALRSRRSDLLENHARRARRVAPEVLTRHDREIARIVGEGILLTEGYDAVHVVEGRAAPRPVRRGSVDSFDSDALSRSGSGGQ